MDNEICVEFNKMREILAFRYNKMKDLDIRHRSLELQYNRINPIMLMITRVWLI
jgi:hypothetical protein